MAINNMESEPIISNESEKSEISKSEIPTSIAAVVERFADPTEITDAGEIIPFFENNLDKNRLCIAIPVTTENEETRKQELAQIGQNLRRAIFEYTGLKRASDIGFSLEGLIGEATSDVAKHTVSRDKFNRILTLVTKDDLNISFHLVNPARPDVNLHEIRQEDSLDEYGTIAHGQNLAEGCKKDLLENGCQSVIDESHFVKDDDSETVAVERDISIELPLKVKEE